MLKHYKIMYTVMATMLASFCTLQTALADTQVIKLSDPNGNSDTAIGTARIKNNKKDVDQFILTVKGLEGNRAFTVFLGESPVLGTLPVQFLGTFVTNKKGKAVFTARTEITDAFAAANPALTDAQGLAPIASGALANGAFGIPLDWIRIYQADADADFGGSVFSRDGITAGGLHVLSSETVIETPQAKRK